MRSKDSFCGVQGPKDSSHGVQWSTLTVLFPPPICLDVQVIKNRLDQLDKQTTAINNHMTRISSCTPTEEEEVRLVMVLGGEHH